VRFAKEMTFYALALSAYTTFAAEQSVPTDNSLHVKAEPMLKSLIPADTLSVVITLRELAGVDAVSR